LLAAACTSAAEDNRKNVLFLSVDDFRPQASCLEMPGILPKRQMHTPNICKLAKESLVLQRSQVAMSTCAPSRAAMVTGRHAGTTRVWDLFSYWRNVSGDFTTIPQLFKQQGYFSVGMGKLFHPGPASGQPGDYKCPACKGGDDVGYSWSTTYFHGKDPLDTDNSETHIAVPANVTAKTPLCDTQVMTKALETIDDLSTGKIGEGKPFFLSVGFHKPHLPWVFPEEFYQYYPEESIELPSNPYAPAGMPQIAWQSYGETRGYADVAKLNASGAVNTTLPDWKTKQLRRAYYASVSYTDYNIGQVLDKLDEVGLANSTVVSLWGDHGWQLGEHGEWDKHTNWDVATHAPVMFRAPGLTDGGISTTQVTETVDIMPTIAELAMGFTVPSCPKDSTATKLCTEGTSLVPLIKDPHTPVKKAALSVYNRYHHFGGADESGAGAIGKSFPASDCLSDMGCAMGYTILTHIDGHEMRYTEWVGFPGPSNGFKPLWNMSFGTELYNHTADPGENANVFDDADSSLLHQLSEVLHTKAA